MNSNLQPIRGRLVINHKENAVISEQIIQIKVEEQRQNTQRKENVRNSFQGD